MSKENLLGSGVDAGGAVLEAGDAVLLVPDDAGRAEEIDGGRARFPKRRGTDEPLRQRFLWGRVVDVGGC